MPDAWEILQSKSSGTSDAWDLLTNITGGGGKYLTTGFETAMQGLQFSTLTSTISFTAKNAKVIFTTNPEIP